MKDNHKKTFKIVFLPFIVAFIVTLTIQFVEWNHENDLIGYSIFENVTLFILVLLGIYLFTLIATTTIEFLIMNKIKSKILYLILFNLIGVGLVLLGTYFLVDELALNSLFLIFPLFSVFSVMLGYPLKK